MAKAAKKSSKSSASSKKSTRSSGAGAQAATVKPVNESFSKSGLVRHLADQADTDPRTVKNVLAALENTMLGAMHKKGSRLFVLPGLLKVTATAVPAKPKRKGKDPFTGEERWFEAKPASVRIKARALKKLKDSAL